MGNPTIGTVYKCWVNERPSCVSSSALFLSSREKKNLRNVFSQNSASVPSLGLHSVGNGAHLEPLWDSFYRSSPRWAQKHLVTAAEVSPLPCRVLWWVFCCLECSFHCFSSIRALGGITGCLKKPVFLSRYCKKDSEYLLKTLNCRQVTPKKYKETDIKLACEWSGPYLYHGLVKL